MRTNYNMKIKAGKTVVNREQLRRVAAIGSFVIIKGGNLWSST